MRQLHIRAQSGPRPVTVAAVRALLADRQLDPTGPVLSLDGGRTWQSAESALAVADGQAVDDGAVDCALRVGPLHPIAMPLGVIGVALLTAAIAFSGSPAAAVIREAPTAAAAATVANGEALVARVHGTVSAGANRVCSLITGLVKAGAAPVTMPASTAPEAAAPAAAPAANGDLLTDWRTLLADAERPAAEWTAAAEALGKRTVAEGIGGWNVRLTNLDVISDANRTSLTAGQTGGEKAMRLAYLEVNGISLLLLVEDPLLAGTCDKLRAEGRDPRITARISSVAHAVADRAAVFNGTLTAAE